MNGILISKEKYYFIIIMAYIIICKNFRIVQHRDTSFGYRFPLHISSARALRLQLETVLAIIYDLSIE